MSDVEIIMERECKSCRDSIGVASPTRLGFSVSCIMCKTFCYDTPGEEIPKAAASWQRSREQAEEHAARARRSKPSRTYNYNGYEMRSIAECRWAAFFDICGIRWQLEPISTGDYIPDFLLLGDAPTIVEVKGGATTLEQLVAQTEYVPERLRGHWNGDVMCLGAHPVLAVSRKGVVMGTIHESYYLPRDGEEWWRQLALASVCAGRSEHDSSEQGKRHDVPRFGVKPESGVYHLRPWDCYNGGHGVGNWPQADIEAKWAEATNRVRYVHGGAKR